MATSLMTTDGRTQRTIDFYAKTNMFMGIGRTSTWTVDGVPNEVFASQTKIEELEAIKRISTKKYVRVQTGGEITFSAEDWTEMYNTDLDLTRTDISFDNTTDEIRTSAGDFSVFALGEKFRIEGSANNDDIIYTVTLASTGVGIAMEVSPAPVTESAGDSMQLRSNLKTNDVHHLYYDCEFDYNNGTPDPLPIGITYRQIGLLEDPYKLDENICDGEVYIPASLSATIDFPAGALHYIDNRVGITRTISQKETIALIIEF